MSQTVSASTEATYGVERVCVVWEQARSTFYDRRERAQRLCQGIMPGKRGPKPVVPDAELLDLIRHDLTTSPFRGQGHRKVGGGCVSGKGCGCLASECCDSCGRTGCCPLIVGGRGASQSPRWDDHHRGP